MSFLLILYMLHETLFLSSFQGARPHGSSSSSQSSSSTSTHGNRQPTALNILGSSSNRHKDKLSHTPSSVSINKHRHQQHSVPAPKVSVPSSSNKLHRSSSPPPPSSTSPCLPVHTIRSSTDCKCTQTSQT